MKLPNCYLVSYDISDPKRLARVHKKMMGFGSPTHYSVFLCHLYPKGHVELIAALDEIIHHDKDRIMIVNLGPSDGRVEKNIEFLGRRSVIDREQAVIV